MNETYPPQTDEDIPRWLENLGIPGIVDLHVHFMPDNVQQKVWQFFDGVAESGEPAWPIVYRGSETQRVDQLRSMGITRFTALNYAHRPGMARWLNTYSASFATQHPDAIHSATVYPEPEAHDIVTEALDDGARIFKVHIQVGGFSPLDPLLQQSWQTLAEAGVPVVIHCGRGPHSGEFTGPENMRELVRQFPSLKLIIAHAGYPDYLEFAAMADQNPNVYLDTTMVGTDYTERIAPMPPKYSDVLAELAGKVVLGTDFPSIPHQYSHQLAVLNSWNLGTEWLTDVLWNTPRRLVGLDSSHRGESSVQ